MFTLPSLPIKFEYEFMLPFSVSKTSCRRIGSVYYTVSQKKPDPYYIFK